MYLGEIVRHVLVTLVDAAPKSLLFCGKSTAVLNKHYGVDTSLMSAVEEAWIGDHATAPEDYASPPLSVHYTKELLSPKVFAKLEIIRKIVAKTLGFDEEDVSLNDAAVGFFTLCNSVVETNTESFRLCDGYLRWLQGEQPC